MIDVQNEIFTAVASAVRLEHAGVTISGEYTRSPSKFPLVTLDEVENVSVPSLIDSSDEEKFAGLGYRLQVFSNQTSGKKAEARALFATADAVLLSLGFRRTTYTTIPEIYSSTIYSITATYEATVGRDGFIYKR